MKNNKKFLMLAIFVSISIFSTISIFAQDPPPPPGNGHGLGSNQPPGGGAPIGSGIVLTISLAAAYGGKKVYDFRKRNLAE
jgi:hypothetical protein